jgi:4-amino-4-deoxy-L-arabinose transferase-like glycosyltransferase
LHDGGFWLTAKFTAIAMNFFTFAAKPKILNRTPAQITLGIALLAALFFLPFLGGVHLFDWDEINFAEAAREMLALKDYLRVYINYEPFWEKPPFFFWLQALAMKIFGVGEYAARLPNALCGILTLVLLFRIGAKLRSVRFGLLWAGAYFGSTLPFLYFKSGIIDPWFNLFIFLGLYNFVLFYWKKERFENIQLQHTGIWYLFWAGFFIGMGMLTKGPVALLIAGLTMTVYWVYKRFRLYVSVPQVLFFLLASTLVGAAWLGLETWKNGPWFVQEFFTYQYRLFSTPDAGHKGFPGYHLAVLALGCFPASVFAMRSFFKMPAEEQAHFADFRRWMKYLFWVVLILFSIVQSKIVHYSSMCYFPLTFLAANVIEQLLDRKITLAGWMRGALLFIGGITATACLALPWLGMRPELLKPLIQDPFGQANLDAAVHWSGAEVLPGIVLAAVLMLFLYGYQKWSRERAFALLFVGNAIFVMLALIFFVKRVEGYSQRAAVEFFKSKAAEDCYIVTHGYKSYAHLFYAAKRPVTEERSYDKEWLLHSEEVDKPAYIVCKIHRADELRANPLLEEIGSKNGFVFFKRKD